MNLSSPVDPCPLCSECFDVHSFDEHRAALRCGRCRLVYVPASQLPSLELERAHYRLHNNDVNDAAYRKFLSRALDPVLRRVAPGSSGLDFGCGPGPALAAMLQEHGYHVQLYDPAFYPDQAPLRAAYDFITCTEVIEHCHDAAKVWKQLVQMLKPSGWLVVMTKRLVEGANFGSWHYARDPTHVRFYSEATFHWVAQRWQCQLHIEGDDVVALRK